MRVLHIQVGVDGVLETLQDDLEEFANSSSTNDDIAVLSDVVFNLRLRDAINGAQPVDGEGLLDREFASAQDIVICRPKFLYAGKPMNLGGGEIDASYKVSALQNIFSSTQIFFHLFITDHVSYLHSHVNWLNKNGAGVQFSWIPVVEAIRSKIVRPNKLCLWNAENVNNTRSDYLAEIFGVSENDVDRFFLLRGVTSEASGQTHVSMENDLRSVGADVHALDDAFEADLEQLQM